MMEHIIGGMLDHDLIEGTPMIEWSMKMGDPDRVIDHGHCSSMIEYDPSGAHQERNIHPTGIMRIHTRVITKTEDPYPIVHLVYHGNSWQMRVIGSIY